MNAITNNIAILLLATGVMLLSALVLFPRDTPPVLGSTARGSEYQGTTTQSAVGAFTDIVLEPNGGTLGQVTITGAAAGTLNFYDATTSSILLRAPSMTTTTVLIASFPASAAAGTYVFDRVFFRALLLNTTGTTPTSTITWRQ